MKPKALVLYAPGTNRDLEAAQALELAGAFPEIVPLTALRASDARRWADFQMLVIPGGFSYADALGAGRLLALDLLAYFAAEVYAFVDSGKPVLGICNGFQALVQAGLLPSSQFAPQSPAASLAGLGQRTATLGFNALGHFECRWVMLQPVSRRCVWTASLAEPLYCPVAHGEGRFRLAEAASLADLQAHDQIALVYAHPNGLPANGQYPANPNGSVADVAGLCNPAGNVLGLMPHPEDHVFPHQHPRWTRGERGGLGLSLFINGVNYAAQS